MPSLQVRELPEHIYQKLKETADTEHRSLAQQAIIALAKGLDLELDPKRRRQFVLLQVKERQIHYSGKPLQDAVDIVNEDRKR